MSLQSVKEKFHSDESAATVFVPAGPAGKGEGAAPWGPVQAVRALPGWRDSPGLNPWRWAWVLGHGNSPCAPRRSFQPEQEDGSHHGDRHNSGHILGFGLEHLERGPLGQISSLTVFLERELRCSENGL